MTTFLVILLIIAIAYVVISLVRGIIAFLQSTKLDLDNPDEADRARQMQLKQNQMMFARIKYQALAIVVVVILLMVSRS